MSGSTQQLRLDGHLKTWLFCTVFSVLIFSSAVSAQVDPTFAPVPSSRAAFTGNFEVQPDGKIIVFGSFRIIQGVMRNGIARLNADGSLDTSFICTICDFSIGSVVVQQDGKIIVAGAKDGGGSAARIRRLNSDGSIDSSFTAPFPENPDGFSPRNYVWAVLPDGKMYVSQHFSFMGDPWSYLYRLNANGSIDGSFARLHFDYGMGQFGPKHVLADLKVLPDGKLMIAGKHDYGFLFRVHPNGTKDTTFQSPVLTSIFTNPTLLVLSFDIQADGKIPLIGFFNHINGVQKEGFARLNADQSLDTSYSFPQGAPSSSSGVRRLELQPDGKLLTSFSGRIIRLNPDGTLDNTFNAPAGLTETRSWTQDGNGKILVAGNFTGEGSRLARLNGDGSQDPTFNVSFGAPPSEMYPSVLTTDGKIVFWGYFDLVNNVPRKQMARVFPDGSLDTSFGLAQGFNSDVYHLAAQADGKILAAGVFTTVDGIERRSFARLNADGSLDLAFNPVLTDANAAPATAALAIQPDGKILIGGEFDHVNGISRTGLARLHPDGSVDATFNPVFTGTAVMLSLLVQEDGKIMVGGIFTSVNGVTRSGVVRLNADGTLDTSFDSGPTGSVRVLTRQSDGKYLTSDRNTIVRRNLNGTTDSTFQSIAFDNQSSIRTILQQTDGTILVGGSFTRVGNDTTQANLTRLASNGTTLPGYFPGGVNDNVWMLTKQPDNKVIVTGAFTSIAGVTRFGVARLNAPVAKKVQFDFDGDGKSDISVFRPSENQWYILRSSDLGVTQQVFAAAGDVPVPSDFDGDRKTDIAIYRPSVGQWWFLSSLNGSQNAGHWGDTGAKPLPSDFDGDGRSDHVFFLPSNSTWYRYGSTVGASNIQFGIAGDKPLSGDFDGDGKSDVAVYRPSTGEWWYAASSQGGAHRAARWGISTDIPAPADYDGDGKTDFAVYRPSNGGWYVVNSSNGSSTIISFGLAEDKPVPADYDGDGRDDIAVFRPSTGVWYSMRSTSGFLAVQFGVSTDIPTPNAFVP